MSYFYNDLDLAVANVKKGKWIGKYTSNHGQIIISNEFKNIPVLSVGSSINLFFRVPKDREIELKEIGIKIEYSYGPYCRINTNNDYKWISICNVGREGWGCAEGPKQKRGYSRNIMKCGGVTYIKRLDKETVLRVELARLIGQIQERYSDLKTILNCYNFKKACDIIIEDAILHTRKTRIPKSIYNENKIFELITI